MLRQQQSKQHRQFASAALLVLVTLFATFVLSCAQEDKPAPVPRARRAGTGTATTVEKPQIDPATVVAVIETAKGTIEFESLQPKHRKLPRISSKTRR